MLIFQAIILGLVQGLTEFIPISSSAHLVIVPWLFGWNDPALTSLTFDVSLHLGTLVAVLWYFRADWVRLLKAGVASIIERKIGGDPANAGYNRDESLPRLQRGDADPANAGYSRDESLPRLQRGDQDRLLAWLLVLGTIPGGIAGILFESKIEALFHVPGVPIQASAMIAMGVIIALLAGLLWLAEILAKHERGMEQITLKDTILIGLAQAFAIFPGVSRSGSTITAGLALGLKRETAARFSFMLSAPIIAGAVAKSALDVYEAFKSGAFGQSELVLFPLGVVVAGVSGYFAISFLLRFLQTNSNKAFVWYRFGLAAVVIAVAVMRG